MISFLPPFFLCLTILTLPLTHCQIPLNSILKPSSSSSWISRNSNCSLQFLPAPKKPSLFLPSITYFGHNSVIIWSTPLNSSVDSNGSLQLLSNGNLRLLNGSGTPTWESNTPNIGVTSALLDDSGKLLLRNSTGVSVWSSFDFPIDTIVPGQHFTVNMNLVNGMYSFRVLSIGNLTLTWTRNTSVEYYTQRLNSSVVANFTNPVLGLQGTGVLTISDPSLASDYNVAYSSDYAEGSDILRFLRLDDDGNLRIYSSARGSGMITERWSAVLDQCRVFGYCGNFGICSYVDDKPTCGCLSQNFELVDPKDPRQGCRRKIKIEDCPGSATMLELEHALFLTYTPELASQVFLVSISACRLNCLVSGLCLASTALSDGTGLCYLKTSDYVTGYQNPALPSTSYVKVCGPVVPNPSLDSTGEDKGRVHAWVVAVVVLATLVGLFLFEGSLWWWCFRNSTRFGGLSTQCALLEYASGAPVQFSYKELQRATKGFKEKLGAGGFGAVYRGVLANRTIVAVKQLEGIEQGEKQFRMEVATISSTHHLNLVGLIGFCSEGRHRLLVYEFMQNGSLDNFLFISEGHWGKYLNWEQRFNIALGTARGITYLHEECRDSIVHCDIKPENILLDENYNAKVSDFGLAKLINPKDHRYRTLMSVRGTRGYLAPEWIVNLLITSKSDVYGYGMVLLEIVSGKRNFEVSPETNLKKFSLWAFEEFEKGNVERIMDRRLADEEVDMEQVTRAIQVSFWCMQEQPSHRPTMGKVVQMLEGIIGIQRPPAPKVAVEESIGITSTDISSNDSAPSTFALSPSVPSSSSSIQIGAISPLASARSIEKASSPLIGSETCVI